MALARIDGALLDRAERDGAALLAKRGALALVMRANAGT